MTPPKKGITSQKEGIYLKYLDDSVKSKIEVKRIIITRSFDSPKDNDFIQNKK
jgi:hypothetical protein